MIKEYDKRDLMKNFLSSKLHIQSLRTVLEINGEKFFVPTREYYLLNDRVMNYYNYVHEAVKNENTLDNFLKILALQSWPMSYMPGKQNNEMYAFLRSFILGRMEEYNIIYLRLVKQKELKDGTVTIQRTHMVGRIGSEEYFDYSTSPFYTFYIDRKEYMVPSFSVQSILDLIEKRVHTAVLLDEIKKHLDDTPGKLHHSNRPSRHPPRNPKDL